jgi:hypothetical protein
MDVARRDLVSAIGVRIAGRPIAGLTDPGRELLSDPDRNHDVRQDGEQNQCGR